MPHMTTYGAQMDRKWARSGLEVSICPSARLSIPNTSLTSLTNLMPEIYKRPAIFQPDVKRVCTWYSARARVYYRLQIFSFFGKICQIKMKLNFVLTYVLARTCTGYLNQKRLCFSLSFFVFPPFWKSKNINKICQTLQKSFIWPLPFFGPKVF